MHLFFTTSCRDTSRITVSFSNVVISFRLFVEFLFPRSIQFSSTFRNFIESHQTDSVTIRSSNFRGFSYYKYYFIFNILKFLKRFVDFLLNILEFDRKQKLGIFKLSDIFLDEELSQIIIQI